MNFIKKNPVTFVFIAFCFILQISSVFLGFYKYNNNSDFSSFTLEDKIYLHIPILNLSILVILYVLMKYDKKLSFFDLCIFLNFYTIFVLYDVKFISSIPEFQWTEEKVKLRQQLELNVCFLSFLLN